MHVRLWVIVEIAITDLKNYMKQEVYEISRKKPIIANRVDPLVEKAIIDMAIEYPAYGQLRVSNELKKS